MIHSVSTHVCQLRILTDDKLIFEWLKHNSLQCNFHTSERRFVKLVTIVLTNLIGQMGKFEVLSLFSEENVINSSTSVGRGQDVSGVGVSKEIDFLFL